MESFWISQDESRRDFPLYSLNLLSKTIDRLQIVQEKYLDNFFLYNIEQKLRKKLYFTSISRSEEGWETNKGASGTISLSMIDFE